MRQAVRNAAVPSERSAASGRRTVVICFLAQNLGAGLTFGSFGPLLKINEAHFDVSRSVASSGMSLIMLAIGLLSPVAGALLQRVSARRCMLGGAALCAAGYLGLAFALEYALALACYALIGCGVCLIAILGPLSFVSRWYERDRGKVLSLVNLPLVLFASPYVIAEMLPSLGRSGVLIGIGALFLLLIPALLALADPPRPIEAAGPASDRQGSSRLIAQPAFWLLSLGLGVIAGASSAFLVHIAPYGLERAMTLPEASGLISAYAAAGILGTLLFGWIADVLGPVRALMVSAALQAICWGGLLLAPGYVLFAVAALLGICAVPQNTLHGASMSALFGAQAVKAMGVSFAIKLPFLFGFAPLVGAMFDATGAYRVPFLVCAASLVGATGLFLALTALRTKAGAATKAAF